MYPYVDAWPDEPERFTPNQTLDMVVAAYHKSVAMGWTDDDGGHNHIVTRKFDFGGETLNITITFIGMSSQPYVNIHAEARTFSMTALVRAIDLDKTTDTGFKILPIYSEKYRLGKMMSCLITPIGHFENMEETLAILKLAVSDVSRD